ncbi:MAG TPA: Calx-beta domain-containing protein, partial [Bacillota bacterium]|nr:Calx-beta domain-containing protein [Bacillota bacterium]
IRFSDAEYTVNENQTVTVTVTRSGNTAVTAKVNYLTGPKTATAGTDYLTAAGTLTFAAGETTKSFTVTTLGDSIAEADEKVNLTLSSPIGAALNGTGGQATALISIIDDDVPSGTLTGIKWGNVTAFAIPLGTTKYAVLLGTYSDGSVCDLTQAATWKSSVEKVATVVSGELVGKAKGTTIITATFGKYTKTITSVVR